MRRDWTYGILLFIGFLLYFFVMRGTELYTEFNLRIFNLAIHAMFIYLAIRMYYQTHPQKESINYVQGTLAGIRPGAVGVILFCLFQIVYLHMDERLMETLKANAMVGTYLNPYIASGVLFFEGLAVTIIVSYISMRVVDAQTKKKYIPQQ
ncbi:MAG: hypothetical protein GVX78_00480 [Bacteroidetes bacterium]|jgi:hypothetical protein|nr:hypothetical protein [Bacteroidota bacterium]